MPFFQGWVLSWEDAAVVYTFSSPVKPAERGFEYRDLQNEFHENRGFGGILYPPHSVRIRILLCCLGT